MNGEQVRRRSSRDIAYLSEQWGCYPFYTIHETLQYMSTIYADFDQQKAMEMLDFMQFAAQQKVSSLSKGNLARLKLVLVLSRKASLILLDEPLSGLDPMIRESILKGLIAFIDLPDQTVIMTTHEVSEVEPLLDMVVALRDGKVIRMDDVENIRTVYGNGLVQWMKETYQ